ncbi:MULTISPECIES: helix-turn-helix transcriptional regulator [Halolamina]|uniref:MarR family protein n=1 Tax=Halolamina pelagica TaxID=699431 RepID=A0A1I5MNZ3_9EURY|nr:MULTISPECIES: helix-turn-helix domain-containing protein [Halolamina]SFP10661.1 MarR family protein [Halolamina pelagica]
MSEVATEAEMADLPPSAKLVHLVLQEHDRMTQSEVTEETQLAGRTVRDALGRLESAGLVTEEICLQDARKRVYTANSPDSEPDPAEAETAEGAASGD